MSLNDVSFLRFSSFKTLVKYLLLNTTISCKHFVTFSVLVKKGRGILFWCLFNSVDDLDNLFFNWLFFGNLLRLVLSLLWCIFLDWFGFRGFLNWFRSFFKLLHNFFLNFNFWNSLLDCNLFWGNLFFCNWLWYYRFFNNSFLFSWFRNWFNYWLNGRFRS